MTNIDKLKAAAAKAVDNFDPNMFVETRDVLALLDELEAVQKTSAARLGAIDTTHKMFQRERDRAEAAEKRIAELPSQKRLIGWRMADYTDETADPALAKNWATTVDVLPIFEGDVNTKLSPAATGKGEAS